MFESRFTSRVVPLPPSAIPLMRTRIRCVAIPGPAPRIEPAQGLLMFSLMCDAGARVSELELMRVDDLLDGHGQPSSSVRFVPFVTKHSVARRVPMHPEVLGDLLKFRESYPGEDWLAFSAARGGDRLLSAQAITEWFRAHFRAAGLQQFTVASCRAAFLLALREAA